MVDIVELSGVFHVRPHPSIQTRGVYERRKTSAHLSSSHLPSHTRLSIARHFKNLFHKSRSPSSGCTGFEFSPKNHEGVNRNRGLLLSFSVL